MKSIVLYILTISMLSLHVFSQNVEEIPSIEKLQGIWKFSFLKDGESKTFESYRIIRDNKMLEVLNDTTYENIRFAFWVIGFWEGNSFPKNIKEFKRNGNSMYYISIPRDIDVLGRIKHISRSNWLTFNENGKIDNDYFYSYSLNGTPDQYTHVSYLPIHIIIKLKKNVILWNKYIDFIGLRKIVKSKSIIHSEPNIPTIKYLLQGYDVEVLEEKGHWLKIRYYGKKMIDGWIRRIDVD